MSTDKIFKHLEYVKMVKKLSLKILFNAHLYYELVMICENRPSGREIDNLIRQISALVQRNKIGTKLEGDNLICCPLYTIKSVRVVGVHGALIATGR